MLGAAAPAPMGLRAALRWLRCPCQFPGIASWVWNKLALMAPALILCGRIPGDSRAITGEQPCPARCRPAEVMGGRGAGPAVPLPAVPHSDGSAGWSAAPWVGL